MGSDDREWVAFHLAAGLGDAKKKILLERFGSPGAVFRLEPGEIARQVCSPPSWARRFVSGREAGAAVLERLERAGGELLRWTDPEYPPALKEIHDPPSLLFVAGERSFLGREMIGIVGARKADRGAASWTEKMAERIGRSGFVVASGMARGIDGAAHRGALTAASGTVAVLGTGLDVIYPRAHVLLAREITAGGGLLLTEHPPGTPPHAHHFPRRNRILAGLCSALVVAQASERSGALITARLALDGGRDVYVLAAPPWERRFAGNRMLARDGAEVVQDGDEVVLRLGRTPPPPPPGPSLSRLGGDEREVASALLDGPKSADEICRSVGSAATVLSALVSLELAGVVEERPGKVYALAGGG